MKRIYRLDIKVVFVLALLLVPSLTLDLNNIESWKRFDVVRQDTLIELPVIDILKFSIETIIDIYESVQTEKNQVEIIQHFSKIEEQIRSIHQELENIMDLLHKMGVGICYYGDEIKIRKTQLIFKKFLQFTTEENLEMFFREVGDLYTNIEHLVGGLLGNNILLCPSGDIFAVVRDDTGVSVEVIIILLVFL